MYGTSRTNTRVAFYISGFGNPSIAICQLTFLRLYVLRTFLHTSPICMVYSNLKDSPLVQKMELNCVNIFVRLFFTTFDVD